MPDANGAFVPGERYDPPRGSGVGPLAGLLFAVKDNIDVAGRPTGNGHPDWPGAQRRRGAHAPAVARLLDGGARLAGKTVMDDLAFSLVGDSAHFGAPRNPRAPERYCGGSSCGAASAVAASQVDFALGTDTAGSIRVPAAATGLFGLRPSHGALPMAGVEPLSPRFDTLGLLAREGHILARAATILGLRPARLGRVRLVWPEWAFALLQPASGKACLHAAAAIAERSGLTLAADETPAPAWFDQSSGWFTCEQQIEVASTIGEWAARARPHLTGDIAARCAAALEAARTLSTDRIDAASVIERDLDARLGSALLAWPTMGGPTPRRDAPPEVLAEYRAATIRFTALSSLTGRPELVLPAAASRATPVGLSIIAPRGRDSALLALAAGDYWRQPGI